MRLLTLKVHEAVVPPGRGAETWVDTRTKYSEVSLYSTCQGVVVAVGERMVLTPWGNVVAVEPCMTVSEFLALEDRSPVSLLKEKNLYPSLKTESTSTLANTSPEVLQIFPEALETPQKHKSVLENSSVLDFDALTLTEEDPEEEEKPTKPASAPEVYVSRKGSKK